MSVSALPNTSAVEIALAKKSKIVTGSEMPPFFAAKLKANGGNPADSILARFGGSVTLGGKVRPGSKTEAFVKASKVPVHIPLSGVTMAFDASGRCTSGC